MARYIQRPDNALKRANEFIDVGKPTRALDTLQDVFRNKKLGYNWSESVIEPIMFKYLDLCVELRKSHVAKEGLFQYRNIFQIVNVGSLESVIRGYLKMAEERAESAQQQSSQAVLDIEDLDNSATPESILMSAVCGEDAQDRSDRTILLPWVKFLWESYCHCLELLRVNTHCEPLYHDIARMTFSFCLKYNRKVEFRKLCEKLRKHLEDICKVSVQATSVTISKAETQQFNLDTRLHQLDSAIQMELWQEAYKAIEDIHGLMALGKKTPVAKTMANYYQKLAMVFWKAGNHLFHAAALLKLFQLTREMKKNTTHEELQLMASHVLVATLAIPIPSAHPEFDRFVETDKSPLEKAQRLAVLLQLQQPPTRISLLKEMVRLNVVQLASDDFKNLYNWLEIEFDPLNLCKRVKKLTDGVFNDKNSILNQYIQAIHDVTLVQLIRQLAQIYQSIEIARILNIATFTNAYYLERILVDCVRHNDMQICIDHKKKCINFGTDLTESQREVRLDGPTLQTMPSEQVRSQLVNMSIVLHRAVAAITPTRKRMNREKLRIQMVDTYHYNKVKEHQLILQRQKIIEDRKETIEKLNIEKEEEELRRQEELLRQQRLAEQKRLEQELEERERKRHANEIQQIKEKSLKEKMQQISQTSHGQKILKKMDEEEIKKLDAEQIAAKEAEELIKERKELQMKLKSQEKKVDYFERAKRIEEIALIEKYLTEKQVSDKEFWAKQEQTRIEQAVAEREHAVAQQARLKRMHDDREKFLNKIREERNSLFVEKVKKFNEFLEEQKKVRLAQRIIDRREERRQKWLKEKEDEKKRREDEIRKAKEEEERIENERKAKEREIENEKLRIQSEKQRAKEDEAERKIQEEREKLSRSIPKERESWRTKERNNENENTDWRNRSEAATKPAATAAAAGGGGGGGGGEGSWRSKGQPRGESRTNDDRPARTVDDRPARTMDERPARTMDDRPARTMDDRPARTMDDRPARTMDDRPARTMDDRRDFGNRDRDAPNNRDADGRRDFRGGFNRRDGARDSPREGESKDWRSGGRSNDDSRGGGGGGGGMERRRMDDQRGGAGRDVRNDNRDNRDNRDRPRPPPTKDGSWRSGRPEQNEERKERPPKQEQPRDEGSWTSVRR